MVDDLEVRWKSKGCHVLGILLDRLDKLSSQDTRIRKPSWSPHIGGFLQRTGYHDVFAEALLPLFSYLPSLTPEHEAVELFEEALPALTSLALLLPDEDGKKESRNRFLDKIMRTGLLSPLGHFPTPCTYPELATTIVSHVPVVVGHMGIETVKHLPHLIPILGAILQEPFALSHGKMVLATLRAVQSVMLNAWPRIPRHRGAIMMGLGVLWGRCLQERGKSDGQSVAEVQSQVKECVGMLDAIMEAREEEGLAATWQQEKVELAQVGTEYAELFAG
ncbi:CCA tRNA nucleotidyltransferase, mitochondrial [Coniothyrium glycines]